MKDDDTIVVSAPKASTIENENDELLDHLGSIPNDTENNNGPVLTENTIDVRDQNYSQLGINVDSSLVPVSVLS